MTRCRHVRQRTKPLPGETGRYAGPADQHHVGLHAAGRRACTRGPSDRARQRECRTGCDRFYDPRPLAYDYSFCDRGPVGRPPRWTSAWPRRRRWRLALLTRGAITLTRGGLVGIAGARDALPREVLYRSRPALACIIGARRAWTVEMISSERFPADRCRSWRGASARAGAGSVAGGRPRAAARQHGRGGAGAARSGGGRQPPARSGAAAAWRRRLTRRARAVGPAITQNNGPAGSVTRSASHGCRAVHPHASIPTSRRRSFLPCLTRIDPRRSSRSVSVSESASLIRSPARHSTTSPLRRLPYRA